jgi:epoxyqueuosine reductase QueG
MNAETAASLIKAKARALGFGACGLARAEAVDAETARSLQQWLDAGYAAGMDYMRRHQDLRLDPRLLQPGARTLIVTALNYYPEHPAPTLPTYSSPIMPMGQTTTTSYAASSRNFWTTSARTSLPR